MRYLRKTNTYLIFRVHWRNGIVTNDDTADLCDEYISGAEISVADSLVMKILNPRHQLSTDVDLFNGLNHNGRITQPSAKTVVD